MVLGGTLIKSVGAVEFSGKAALLESVSFYSGMFGATYFGLVLGDSQCDDSPKVYCKLVQDKFYEVIMVPFVIILAMLEKIMHFFFFFKSD